MTSPITAVLIGAGQRGALSYAPYALRYPDQLRFVAVAERFLHVPYLWGGKTSLGLDCSALVQVALGAAGIEAPRDSDMQQQDLGMKLPIVTALPELRRGDLVFWPGHVGIMQDPERLLHADAHHMAVASEPLGAALARFGAKGITMTAVRRLA